MKNPIPCECRHWQFLGLHYSAVAHGILFFRCQLGRRALGAERQENGIVTEARGAARLGENTALPGSGPDDRSHVGWRPHEGDDALVAPRTPRRRQVSQLSEQFHQILTVSRTLTGITCGIHAGTPTQRIYFDARVVRQRRKLRE